MIVVGQLEDGGQAFRCRLEQGADPRVLGHDRGYLVLRPLDAVRSADGELELGLLVRPLRGEARPVQPGRGRDPGLGEVDPSTVEVRQRVAAYAVVLSSGGLLATEFSDRTAVPGRWGLPGGGIDDHEQPPQAVLREVAEETQQSVVLQELYAVQTSHWVGRSPRGTVEDYHAVRLVYLASCARPTTPVVVDVGGTTRSARWVPVDSWQQLPWTVGWRLLLDERLGHP